MPDLRLTLILAVEYALNRFEKSDTSLDYMIGYDRGIIHGMLTVMLVEKHITDKEFRAFIQRSDDILEGKTLASCT